MIYFKKNAFYLLIYFWIRTTLSDISLTISDLRVPTFVNDVINC